MTTRNGNGRVKQKQPPTKNGESHTRLPPAARASVRPPARPQAAKIAKSLPFAPIFLSPAAPPLPCKPTRSLNDHGRLRLTGRPLPQTPSPRSMRLPDLPAARGCPSATSTTGDFYPSIAPSIDPFFGPSGGRRGVWVRFLACSYG